MKTVAIIQARMGSTRLPGKVLKPLGFGPGAPPVLERVVTAVETATGIDEVWVATSTLDADQAIVDWCMANGVNWARGSESDVLSRFMVVADLSKGEIFLRLTGDCPFLDPRVISEVVALREVLGVDYASNIDPATWPDGLDVECFTRRALETAHQEATRPIDRDCVTRFISRNRTRFKAANLTCPLPGLDKERWVLDSVDDYDFCRKLTQRIAKWPPSYLDILAALKKEPELRKINQSGIRNERFYEALSEEKQFPRPTVRSSKLLERAERLIPLGAQTFSKSKIQFPNGSPLFLSHGDGAYVYDVDGNDYVDLVSGLLPVILGYRDVDVDRAIRDGLDRGISLSLATELEYELAQRLNRLIPCAEMVRFGKSGTDVTNAAVRLARHFTKRERILSSGYHGWGDWAVGNDAMRGNGVPAPVKLATDTFEYGSDLSKYRNDLDAGEYACVIVEPETNPEFLRYLRERCHQTGTLLIFDEVITGFRWSLGGAQKRFGVTPDLACFGKAMGNGMPISAIVGRKDIMKLMAPPDNIFYSGTFFGECLSLAAACATIDKLEREMVPFTLSNNAWSLEVGIKSRLKDHGLDGVITNQGGPLNRLSYKNRDVQDLFIKGMAENGILLIASHNLTWAHRDPQFRAILRAYDAVLPKIAETNG